jgi:hypothetical protein
MRGLCPRAPGIYRFRARMWLALGRLAPPPHSGRWVGAPLASLRCRTLRPGEPSINQSPRERKLGLSTEVYSQSEWYKTSVRSHLIRSVTGNRFVGLGQGQDISGCCTADQNNRTANCQQDPHRGHSLSTKWGTCLSSQWTLVESIAYPTALSGSFPVFRPPAQETSEHAHMPTSSPTAVTAASDFIERSEEFVDAYLARPTLRPTLLRSAHSGASGHPCGAGSVCRRINRVRKSLYSSA